MSLAPELIRPQADPAPRRPRVLHCVSHLALGGAERVALSITDALRAENVFGVYAVRGLGDGEMGRALADELRRANVPLFTGPRVPMRLGGMITGSLGMARAIRRFGPDLLHLHTEIPEASYATMVQFLPTVRRIPVVRTIHNAVFWHFWNSLGRWCDRRLAHAFAAGVSIGATAAARQLRSLSGAPPPPEEPVLIYNGVPRSPPSGSLDARRPRDPDVIRVVFAGRLEDQKGADLLPTLLRLAQLPPKRAGHLTVFGSGKHAGLLERLVDSPPPGWSIDVRPPTPDFRQTLSQFDLILIPSRFEGLPLIAIEAGMEGCPVVATDAPGLREALPPGHPWTGRANDVHSIAAVFTAALAAPERWEHVARITRAFFEEHFSLDRMAAGYRDLYRRALMSVGTPSIPS